VNPDQLTDLRVLRLPPKRRRGQLKGSDQRSASAARQAISAIESGISRTGYPTSATARVGPPCPPSSLSGNPANVNRVFTT
jgi:hypothetical protein